MIGCSVGMGDFINDKNKSKQITINIKVKTVNFNEYNADYVFFRTRLRSQLNPKSRLLKDFHTLPLASQIGLIVTD